MTSPRIGAEPTPRSAKLFVFARFHAHPGGEVELEQALREVRTPTRAEPGCIEHNVYRSTRDPRLFWVHSRWRDEASFENHGQLDHTLRFVARVESLIDHPLEVSRSEALGEP